MARDLTNFASTNWLTDANLLNITEGAASSSILLFQNELQGRFTDGFLGMHAAGHFSVGGDEADLFSSPTDPIFWLHHAMVDRVWWMWQALHSPIAETVAGTITINNNPPSRDTTKDDLIVMTPNGETKKIGDLLNTIGGTPLCYVYA